MNALSNPTNYQELWDLAKLMYLSGFFETHPDPETGISQLATRILAGQELGYAPFTSVQNIRVFRGKPELSANLMAAAVKRHTLYDYSVDDIQDDSVTLLFYKNQEVLGASRFSHEDALQAGLMTKDTYQKYPRNLFFARAMSNGVRWFVPDVFLGAAVYVEGEISGANVQHPDIPGLAAEAPTSHSADAITLENVPAVDANTTPAIDTILWQKPDDTAGEANDPGPDAPADMPSSINDEQNDLMVKILAMCEDAFAGDDLGTELDALIFDALKVDTTLEDLTPEQLQTLYVHLVTVTSEPTELIAMIHEHGIHLFGARWTDAMPSFISDFFNFNVDTLDDLNGHELGLLYKHLEQLEEAPAVTPTMDPLADLRQTIHLHAAAAFGDAVIAQLDSIITNLFNMSNRTLKDLNKTQLTTLHDRLIIPGSTPAELKAQLFKNFVEAFAENWGHSLTRICDTMFHIQVTELDQLNHAQLQILAQSFVDIKPAPKPAVEPAAPTADQSTALPDNDPHAVDPSMSITAINNEIKLLGEGIFGELWAQKRREQINRLTNERTSALSKLSREEAAKLLRGLRILGQQHAQALKQQATPA